MRFQGNRFSVLETFDDSVSSTAVTTPSQSNFTFSKPLPDVDPQACITSDSTAPLITSERGEINDSPTQTAPLHFAKDMNVSSSPTTSPSAPQIRLPGSYPSESDDTNGRSHILTLRDFTIPSPLLYHKKSREDLLGLCEDSHDAKDERFALLCGQDPPDPDFESFRLGSPLQRPQNRCETQALRDGKIVDVVPETPSGHDMTFYQRTRTYLASPSDRTILPVVAVTPKVEYPIVTTTNTLRKRQTHVYPGEFALTPPPTLPSCIWDTGRPSADTIEQRSPGTSALVTEPTSRDSSSRGHASPKLTSSPPRPLGEVPADPSTWTANIHDDESRKRSARTSFPSLTFRGRSPPDDTIFQPSSVLEQQGDVPSTRQPNSSGISNQIQTAKDHYESPCPRIALPTPPTTPLPSRPFPKAPSSPSPPKPLSTPSSDLDTDLIEIQACPTESCTALLVVLPDRTGQERAGVEVAKGNVVWDLGFEGVHGVGCGLGVEEAGRGKGDGAEMDALAVIGEMEGEVNQEGAEERGSEGADEDGWEDDWVGEGEGVEFWV